MSKESKSTAVLDAPGTSDVAGTNYWQIGLTSFNNGDPATVCMQKIWNAMFPASLTLVAQIVGALYADHYFVDTQMSVSLLAQELNAALGKNPADCQRAAAAAFSQWFGLSVRANFADTAIIPRQGSLTLSPDVVVNGTVPLSVQQLISMWNQTVWGPVSNDKNVTYGRASSVNIGVPITAPTVQMFVTDGGLNNPPNQWVQLFTSGGNRTVPLQNMAGTSTLQPGDRAASSDALFWTPQGSGHYCVIAVAGSEFFANDPAKIPPGNWNSVTWITYNGAAGWHNVDTLTSSEASLKIYNQDGTHEQYEFEAHCSGVPAGTEVSLSAEDPMLPSIIRSNGIRIVAKEQIVRAAGALPGNYAGDLKVRIKTPDGKPLPARASVEVRMFWTIPPGHRHYEDAVGLLGDTQAIALHRPARVEVGSFTFIGK